MVARFRQVSRGKIPGRSDYTIRDNAVLQDQLATKDADPSLSRLTPGDYNNVSIKAIDEQPGVKN